MRGGGGGGEWEGDSVRDRAYSYSHVLRTNMSYLHH